MLDAAPVKTDQDYSYPQRVGNNSADVMGTIDGKVRVSREGVMTIVGFRKGKERKRKGRAMTDLILISKTPKARPSYIFHSHSLNLREDGCCSLQ